MIKYQLSVGTFFLSGCLAVAAAATVNLKDFGAVGDGRTDDGPALAKALDALRQRGPGSTLLLPSGRYLIKPVPPAAARTGNVIIDGFSDVTITGEKGTVLLMTNSGFKGVRMINCRRTALKDLTVEYYPAPFTQGTVRKWESPRQIIIDLDPLAAPMPGAGSKKLMMSLFDRDRMDHSFHRKDVKAVELLTARRYRIVTTADFEQDPTGRIVAILCRNNACTAFNTENSEDCRLENIRIHSGPASAFSSHANSGMIFRNCRVEPGPGMVMSTCADGLHVKHNRRGPLVENCYFSGMYDDSINISTSYACIFRQDGDKLVINGGQYFRAGDTIAIVDIDGGRITGRHKINAIARIPYGKGKATQITLDSLPKIERTVTSMKAVGSFDQLFNRPSPLPNFCINLDTCGEGAIIRGNVFRNHRARGILLRAPNAVIANNLFENLRGPAILIGPELAWLEGGNPENITITGNRFVNIGKTNILIGSVGTSHQRMGTERWNRNLRIVDNIFAGYGIPAIEGSDAYGDRGTVIGIDNADNVTVTGNRIEASSPSAPAAPRITLGNCSGITITGNRICGNGPWLKQTGESRNIKTADNIIE